MVKRRKIWIGIIITFIGLLAWNVFYTPALFMGEAFGGKILDEITGKPVPGVVIAAVWPLERRVGAFHPSTITTVHIELMEVVSDENGNFKFPAWGPRLNATLDAMQTGNPRLLIFKPGYFFKHVGNLDAGKFMAPRRWKIVHRSDWDGKIIHLKPNEYEHDPSQYRFSGFDVFGNFLKDVIWLRSSEAGAQCYAKQVPKMIAEYEKQRLRFRSFGIDTKIYDPIDQAVAQDKNC